MWECLVSGLLGRDDKIVEVMRRRVKTLKLQRLIGTIHINRRDLGGSLLKIGRMGIFNASMDDDLMVSENLSIKFHEISKP